MTPYEALYGRKCKTHLCLFEVEDTHFLGSNFVQQTTKQINIIREKMKIAGIQKCDGYIFQDSHARRKVV